MKKLHILLGVVGVIAVAAGVGYAAVPSSNGTISACKDNRGTLKVIDVEGGQSCNANQQLLSWNQQGPPGPAATSGREIVGGESLQSNGATLKNATAYCPSGKVPLGGGAALYAVAADGSATLADGIALQSSGPIHELNGVTGWFALARVVNPTTASPAWKLTVTAICVASS